MDKRTIMNVAIIHAGGSGSRMRQKKNKIFVQLAGKPILFHTLKIFEQYKQINQIIITAQKQDFLIIRKITKHKIILAGKTRQESSHLAIKKLRKLPKNSYILIHNAANPFVTQKEISQVLQAAKKHGASLLAHPIKDTVKQYSNQNIKTLNRDYLWAAQTPQVVRLDLALQAFAYAHKKNFVATDDASVIEFFNKPVKIVKCSEQNFKITYPQDLILAKQILLKNLKT